MKVGTRPETHYILVDYSFTPPRANIGAQELSNRDRLTGYLKCGYHFVIKRTGDIDTGRSIDEVSGCIPEFNQFSISICLIGGLDKDYCVRDTFTEEQKKSLVSLLRNLMEQFPEAIPVHRCELTGDLKTDPVLISFRELLLENSDK